MKPSETKVAGHKRNRETAPLKGRSLVSPHVALQRAAGRAWPSPYSVSISLYYVIDCVVVHAENALDVHVPLYGRRN